MVVGSTAIGSRNSVVYVAGRSTTPQCGAAEVQRNKRSTNQTPPGRGVERRIIATV